MALFKDVTLQAERPALYALRAVPASRKFDLRDASLAVEVRGGRLPEHHASPRGRGRTQGGACTLRRALYGWRMPGPWHGTRDRKLPPKQTFRCE